MAENKKRKKQPRRGIPLSQLRAKKAEQRAYKKESSVRIWLAVFYGIIFLLAALIFSVSLWYDLTFDLRFSDLLSTMISPLEGMGAATVWHILIYCLPLTLLLEAAYIAAVLILWKKDNVRNIIRRIGAVLCVIALLLSSTYSFFAFRAPEYFTIGDQSTDIYETDYIDPKEVEISDKDGNAQNLICIYLESMETTYASKELGGAQDKINYIPRLTSYASDKSNISFSSNSLLGGFHSVEGTGRTIGAFMGTTAGVPFSTEAFADKTQTSQGKDGTFANGLTTIGDILAEKGYSQEFLCGSNASFAGRDTYFKVHGNYKIFDYNTAIEEGYIDEDYYVWWGLEDQILFDIARDEVSELAKGDKPFNLTMLTVDTHHVGGYRCSSCGSEYESNLGNVLSCSDTLVYDFIEWCKTQDFYKNTTIVLIGDHPRMDTHLVKDIAYYDRTMYNCIFNSVETPYATTKNRTFSSLDMFPTVLAAMGFEIEGERLGLGTNLFSPLPTLLEKAGGGTDSVKWLDSELIKESEYYKKNFLKK